MGRKDNRFKSPKQIQKPFAKGPCFVCGKPGHIAIKCHFRKGQDNNNNSQPKPQANLAEFDDIIVPVVSEVNLVVNFTEWVVDTGATRHICANKDVILNYENVTNGEKVFMEDSRATNVAGKGKVLLKLTSRKIIALQDVLHVPDIRRNLVSGSLLNKADIKLVFESDKLVLTRNGKFVGKGFCNEGLFVLDASAKLNNKNASFAYIVESLNMWHARLYVNMTSIKKLKQL